MTVKWVTLSLLFDASRAPLWITRSWFQRSQSHFNDRVVNNMPEVNTRVWDTNLTECITLCHARLHVTQRRVTRVVDLSRNVTTHSASANIKSCRPSRVFWGFFFVNVQLTTGILCGVCALATASNNGTSLSSTLKQERRTCSIRPQS